MSDVDTDSQPQSTEGPNATVVLGSLAAGIIALFVATVLLFVLSEAPSGDPREEPETLEALSSAEVKRLAAWANQTFGPLAAVEPNADSELGHKLFFDRRLSKDGQRACVDCHDVTTAGTSEAATSEGLSRNAPTVFNLGEQSLFLWGGDADELPEALRLHLDQLGITAEHAAATLNRKGYAEGVGDRAPERAAVEALSAYLQALSTPGRFDRFMNGEHTALSPSAARGLKSLKASGCVTCHNGPTLGGSQRQKLGLQKPWETEDQGLFERTGKRGDRGLFKVPTLRFVAKTGPWLHDGSLNDLGDVVRRMGVHQVGVEPSKAQVKAMLAFLDELDGDPPAELIARPKLPD